MSTDRYTGFTEPMADMLLTVVIPPASGLPEDDVINTWAVSILGTTSGETMAADLAVFYNTFNTLFAPSVSRAANAVEVFAAEINLVDNTLEPKDLIGTFTITGSAPSEGLPNEVALCTSLRATGGGSTPARGRGRVYLGPWSIGVTDPDGAGVARPTSAVINAVADATEQLNVDMAANDATLSVWSRADHTLYSVTGGWVDNEWDTVRSRGRKATTRIDWGA